MTASQAPAEPARLTPSLRPARLDDYPRIERLESSHGLLTTPTEAWRALWLENPLRSRLGDGWPIGWVLEDAAGRLVGSIANVPTRYVFQGRDLIAATGRAWVVEPEYRGVALWLMGEYFDQEGVDLFINTTVNAMAVDPFSAFGSSRVPLGDWRTAAYWITDYRGFAAAALRIKNAPWPSGLAPPVALALKGRDLLRRQALPPFSSGVEIAQCAAFGDDFDPFWRELVRLHPDKLLSVRDRETLTWHFRRPLQTGDAWILTATRQGRLRAYCVLKRQDHPPSGLKRMRLVDYQSLEPDEDHLSGLLRAALRRCALERIHTLEHVGGDIPKMRAFDSAAPQRRKLPAWPFYFKAADSVLDEVLKRPEFWDPSTYDGDASV